MNVGIGRPGWSLVVLRRAATFAGFLFVASVIAYVLILAREGDWVFVGIMILLSMVGLATIYWIRQEESAPPSDKAIRVRPIIVIGLMMLLILVYLVVFLPRISSPINVSMFAMGITMILYGGLVTLLQQRRVELRNTEADHGEQAEGFQSSMGP